MSIAAEGRKMAEVEQLWSKLLTEPSKDQKLKSISFKFRGAYVHEKTYGGGSVVAERVYIIIYGLKPAH